MFGKKPENNKDVLVYLSSRLGNRKENSVIGFQQILQTNGCPCKYLNSKY